MQAEKREIKAGVTWALIVGALALSPFAYADEANNSGQKTLTKKCMSDILQGCSDREQRTSQALVNLMDKLSAASNSNHPDKMKAALEDSRNALAEMKKDHDKSSEVLNRLHDRVEKLKKQIKVTKQEHEKAASMIEDSDMDDPIWAY